MLVTHDISKGIPPLTEQEQRMLEEALKREPICDEDCPELNRETEIAMEAAARQRDFMLKMQKLREERAAAQGKPFAEAL